MNGAYWEGWEERLGTDSEPFLSNTVADPRTKATKGS
jgi:hypothetical protein